MANNDLFKTILEIDDDATNIDLTDSIEYVNDSDDNSNKTVLDESSFDEDYVQYGGGSGFTFQVEGIDDEHSETPLSNHLRQDMTLKDNRYKIIKVVGAGGFGVVYKALDTKLGIEVAIKELYPSSLVNRVPGEKKMVIYGKDNAKQYAYLLDRFILEARSMAKFNSVKNIVNIFDCFQENNTAYIVMEFIKGRTLEQFVEDNGGKLDVETATKLMNKILDGLASIHAKGIIHRDIKPKNIFITNDDELKIIDFGAARFSSTEEQVVTRYSKVLTPGFAPPEQYRKDSKQGPYTDIYAASAVYYYMLTGVIPEISVDRVVKDDIKPLREVAENVPECVERAIGRALELNSDLRLQTATELKNGLNGKTIIRYVAEEKRMRFRKRIIIIAATVLVLCIAAVGVVIDKMNKAQVITIDKLVSENTEISITVPLDSNSSITNSQIAAWENIAQEFETYVSENSEIEIKLQVQFAGQSSYIQTISKDNPTVYYSVDNEDTPQMKSIRKLISEDTTVLFSMYEEEKLPENSYIIAFDPTVMYVNKKLMSDISENITDEDMLSIKNILNIKTGIENAQAVVINETDIDYYKEITEFENKDDYFTPLEKFCMGEALFYIGHASESLTISNSLPGMYTIVSAPDIDGIRAVGYEWQISSDCSENEVNAAQLLLSFVTGEDAQDILFVQLGSLVPVNPPAFEKYMEYNPQIAFIADEIDNITFVAD